MKMKLHLRLFILLILISSLSYPQVKKVTIIVEADTIPINSSVYISGNRDKLGYWNRMKKMDMIKTNLWSYQLTENVGDTLIFKFTRGDWTSEAVDSNGIEFPNNVHVVRKDTILKFRVNNWRDLVVKRIIIDPERLKNKDGYLELVEGWKFKIGDDTSWAAISYDDSDWETINPLLEKNDFEKLKWTGNIWFRNYITVDSSLLNKPFGLRFFNTGAAEVYLNGKLIFKNGVIGNSTETEVTQVDRNPRIIMFEGGSQQVLAVRYSNHYAEKMIRFNIPAGFSALIGDMDAFISQRFSDVRDITLHQFAFGAFVLAFAIMHLLLFIFYPKAKENLYYSISMLSFATVIFSGAQSNFINSILSAIDFLILNSVSVQTSVLFGLLTVYASSYQRMPKQSVFFVVVYAIFIVHTLFFTGYLSEIMDYAFYIFILILTLEIFRVVVRSIYRKEPWGWSWVIGVGFLVAIIFIAYQVLIITGIIENPLFGIYLVYVYGIVFLAITVSINLSKKVSDTNKDLEKQLVQVKELSAKAIDQERKAREEELARKLLEADNKRKTYELEEAQKLQLSMLPRNLPVVPSFDIAVYMKPAFEVGGDYYDFKYDNNGPLIVAIGDATGHGMKAGTMVATIKGLFSAESIRTEIIPFYKKCSNIIKDMNLGNLYMAMMIASIENSKLKISSAGMPPLFLYRQKTKLVEEIRLPGMPLGSFTNFDYLEKTTSLEDGDTILLMSDGFPELFNPEKQILGYEKAKELFQKTGSKSSSEIINFLNNAAEEWRKGARQEDDITFIVLKFKSSAL
ncbi:MAG: SpoIIE family protein phosphatase [Ignavibacteriaceae bacterium]|nr:SpoIIE family protein phosphatase [Ignavibacteriaceae bacterium]